MPSRPLPTALTYVVTVALAISVVAPASAQVALRNLVLKAHLDDYSLPGDWGYSACWGYVHPDGREYAVIGTHFGTAIYNVTNPDNVHSVGFIPGLASYWREMKAYRNWIYVVTENAVAAGGITPGVQIISMIDPENPVLVATYSTNFNRSHTVQVDTSRAILICNGTNLYDGAGTFRRGMRILSLANPVAPVEIGSWPDAALLPDPTYYIHDCVVAGNRLYGSSIYAGIERIFDFTTPSSPVEIRSWTYPGAYYTHSAWPTEARDRLYVCDEQNGQTLRVFDIANENVPALVNEWTSNPQSIIHNPRVKGADLWLANYTEGIRVLDVSDPSHPAEWGYADSYPGSSGGYNGVWECYPYFPSGTVIASDMNTGLYVYRAVRNFGVVYARVKEGPNPLSGAKVYVQTAADSALTGADGTVAFAPSPGACTIVARKFGYQDATANLTVGIGDHITVNLTLVALPTTTFTGRVIDAGTLAGLEGAEVNVAYTPLHDHTDLSGAFNEGTVPVGHYRIEIERPGYVPIAFERNLGPQPETQTFKLAPAKRYDPLTTDQGWVVGAPADNAVTGVWVRVEPLGTSIGGTQPVDVTGRAGDDALTAARGGATALSGTLIRPRPGPLHEGHEGEGAAPGQVQPEYDRSPLPDSLCWVTGQGVSPTAIDEADVDGPGASPGVTTLTTPIYDLTAMIKPTIGYWCWFYTQFGSPDDWLAVLISNDGGANWTSVDTLRGLHNHWEEEAVLVTDHLPATNQMRLRFVAADQGVPSVVEAGIDDISIYDAAGPIITVPPANHRDRLSLRPPAPNPARGTVSFVVESPGAGLAGVEVLDLTGRRVATLLGGDDAGAAGAVQALQWAGTDDLGHEVPPGLYFIEARAGSETARAKLVRVR
jgi:choice-of-anchor B domain-containing protein